MRKGLSKLYFMKVRYNPSRIHELGIGPEIERNYASVYNSPSDRLYSIHGNPFDRNLIDEGFECTVYALRQSGLLTSYYLLEPKWGSYTHFPGFCFDVIDPRISRYWVLRHNIVSLSGRNNSFEQEEVLFFSPKEWAEEPSFLSSLVEMEERETKIMNRIADLMDREFD